MVSGQVSPRHMLAVKKEISLSRKVGRVGLGVATNEASVVGLFYLVV